MNRIAILLISCAAYCQPVVQAENSSERLKHGAIASMTKIATIAGLGAAAALAYLPQVMGATVYTAVSDASSTNPFASHLACTNRTIPTGVEHRAGHVLSPDFISQEQMLQAFGGLSAASAVAAFTVLNPQLQYNALNQMASFIANCANPIHTVKHVGSLFGKLRSKFTAQPQACEQYAKVVVLADDGTEPCAEELPGKICAPELPDDVKNARPCSKQDNLTMNNGTWTQLVANGASGSPVARFGLAIVIDKAGKIWIFGGQSIISNPGGVNDLWSYSTQSNGPWIQVIANGVNGSPAPRAYHTMNIDYNGVIWLFGGYRAYEYFNDLHSYSTQMQNAAWNQHVTAISPEARCSHATVIDTFNNLWMFGGMNVEEIEPFAGLWQYIQSTNVWRRIPIYPPSGPQARYGHSMAIDALGNLWLFGGLSVKYNDPLLLQDFWSFQTRTFGPWIQIKYPITSRVMLHSIDSKTSSLVLKSTQLDFWPSARGYENMVICSNGVLMMFGGETSVDSNTDPTDFSNTLWSYNTLNNSTGWDVLSFNGTVDAPAARAGAGMIRDSNNRLYIFGGFNGTNQFYFNDLWQFTPNPQ